MTISRNTYQVVAKCSHKRSIEKQAKKKKRKAQIIVEIRFKHQHNIVSAYMHRRFLLVVIALLPPPWV